ncbi:MAG TPA: hypothetical protein PLU10_03550 [Chitinophagaceae bacterium]|nr:hypothetical protein [Chitinophagaceae bacterium]
MKRIEKFLGTRAGSFALFFCCWIGVFAFYFPAQGAMLIDDGVSGIYEWQTKGLRGFLSSFGFDSFYHGHYAFMGLFYLLFGTNSLGWFIVFTGLHALITTLIFNVFAKLYSALGNTENNTWIGLSGAILFLCSSYQSENIVWAATSHYAITLLILLLSLSYLLDEMQGQSASMSLLVFHGIFAWALLTLEISFLFPLVYFIIYVALLIARNQSMKIGHYLLRILLPQVVFIGVYMVLHKWCFGIWLPHDRAPLDAVVSWPQMFTTLTQQLVKLFGFVHYLDFPKRDWIYNACTHWKKGALVVGVLWLLLSVWMYRKGYEKILTTWLLLLLGLLMYAPFLRLYFMYIARMENDRYSYFASVILFQLLVFVLFQTLRWLRLVVIGVYLCLFCGFTWQNISARANSAAMHQQFLNKFPEQISHDLYVLNVPVSCQDAYLFRTRIRIPIAYRAYFGKALAFEPYQVAFYNAQGIDDSFEVKKINDSALHVQLKTNGSWWMNEGLGATPYSTPQYEFVPDESGGYMVTFKQPISDLKIYLFEKNRFRAIR